MVLAGSFFLPDLADPQDSNPISPPEPAVQTSPLPTPEPPSFEKNEPSIPETTSSPEEQTVSVADKEEVPITDETNTCTFTIRCDTILKNLNQLKPEKKNYVPADGIILAPQTFSFVEGDSVFDLLLSITRTQGIPMEYTGSMKTKNVYVEGIAHLYEFDCGSRSGWTYRVNGKVADRGCAQYQLQNQDKVEFLYTCDWGNDLGASL